MNLIPGHLYKTKIKLFQHDGLWNHYIIPSQSYVVFLKELEGNNIQLPKPYIEFFVQLLYKSKVFDVRVNALDMSYVFNELIEII